MKSLAPPTSLLLYESLHSRKRLSPQERQRFEQLRKGYLGEKRLESLLKAGNYKNIEPLYDCLFEVDEREVQIDCILLTSERIFLLEVKNYTGDYYWKNNHIYYLQTHKEVYNPINQLSRTEFLFKQLLNELQVNIPVCSRVVFVNFDFKLYGSLVDMPMIYPSQIKRFLQKTNNNAPYLTDHTRKLAKILTERGKRVSTYARYPKYNLTELKRGVFCKNCSSELIRQGQLIFTCPVCCEDDDIKEVVFYAIAQFHLLFPRKKITTTSIKKWCGDIFSKSFLRSFLNTHFNVVRKSRYTYYFFEDERKHIELLSQKYDNPQIMDNFTSR